jgi:hypothetical protein
MCGAARDQETKHGTSFLDRLDVLLFDKGSSARQILHKVKGWVKNTKTDKVLTICVSCSIIMCSIYLRRRPHCGPEC